MIDACFAELEPLVGTAAACRGSGKSRASHYRRLAPPILGPPLPSSTPANALSQAETAELLAVLRSTRFCDLAPAQVWAILLDEGSYLASISTMYRVLRGGGEVRERRAQATHPARARPELMADRPNMCWTWDITKLRGPAKGVWFDCYVIIDIFSRYVVGWMVATTETAELAEAVHHRRAGRPGCREGNADHPRRPGHVDDLQGCRRASRRSRCRAHPLPPACEQRQPLLRGGQQDPQVLPGVPGPLRFHPRRPGVLRDLLRLLQP